jgi:hypothetical protein
MVPAISIKVIFLKKNPASCIIAGKKLTREIIEAIKIVERNAVSHIRTAFF